MSTYVAAAGRRLPRGWADLWLQVAIWFGFLGAYQLARGAADRGVVEATENGRRLIELQSSMGALFELDLQRVVESSALLERATALTYWLSQFAVLGTALLWVYLARNEKFLRFRNTVLLANVIGLVGYVAYPTAPPRFFPEWGFSDTLAKYSALNHGSGLIELASNQFAAMPSLHSADALIVGIVMAGAVRSRSAKALWLAWPPWVWFTVMGTGNHYWLDIAVGLAVAAVAAAIVYRPHRPWA